MMLRMSQMNAGGWTNNINPILAKGSQVVKKNRQALASDTPMPVGTSGSASLAAGGMGQIPASTNKFNPANYLVDPNQGNLNIYGQQSAAGPSGSAGGILPGGQATYPAQMNRQAEMQYNTANMNASRTGGGSTASWSGALGGGSVKEPAGSIMGKGYMGGNVGTNGSFTPAGGGGGGSGGGAGAVALGGGNVGAGGNFGGSSVGQAIQNALNAANTENNTRYNQELGLAGQLQDTSLANNNLAWQNTLAQTDQSAISRGIGNTSALDSLRNGVNRSFSNAAINAGNLGTETALGIIDRRSDQAPNVGLLAGLAGQPGATGGGFGATGGGGGYSGGGGGGGLVSYNPTQYMPQIPGGVNGGLSQQQAGQNWVPPSQVASSGQALDSSNSLDSVLRSNGIDPTQMTDSQKVSMMAQLRAAAQNSPQGA